MKISRRNFLKAAAQELAQPRWPGVVQFKPEQLNPIRLRSGIMKPMSSFLA